MATLGTIPMTCTEDALVAGGAFLLAQTSSVSQEVILPDGSQVQVAARNPYAVVRTASLPQSKLFESAFLAVQAGLDWLSVMGKCELSVRDAEDEHLLWWVSDGIATIRVASTFDLRFSVPSVRISVDGQEPEPPDAPLTATAHHGGFRYYRLAQITEDLHDAYRNMYLAFELTLSRAFPKNRRERETEWLRRALNSAEQQLNLSQILKVPPSDTADFLIDRVYQDARLPLFHAKYNRDYYAPQSVEDNRGILSEALAILTRVVLCMFEGWHGVRRRGGMVYSGWVYKTILAQWSGARIIVSDHQELGVSENDLSHAPFQHGVPMCNVQTNNGGGGRPELTAVIDANKLDSLSDVRRFDVINEEAPLMAQHVIETSLDLKGFDQCQFLGRARVSNRNQPKTLFKI